MNKEWTRSYKKLKIKYKPTKKHNKDNYDLCKVSYCNPTCKGYDFSLVGDAKAQEKAKSKFRSNLKNGFINTYTPSQISMLQKKGAESGCGYMGDYMK